MIIINKKQGIALLLLYIIARLAARVFHNRVAVVKRTRKKDGAKNIDKSEIEDIVIHQTMYM